MRGVLLNSPELDAYGQMALDEALLVAHPAGILQLRFYRWPGGAVLDPAPGRNQVPAAVTFGYFQRYEDVIGEIRSRGLAPMFPVARRPTGGGIVYHDGDITFSVIFPWNRLETASWVYKNMHRGVHLGLKALGLRSQLWSPPNNKYSQASVCFAEPAPMDLVGEDGKKILGGALRRRAGVGLYQGSMRPEGFKASRDRLLQAVVEGLGLEWKVLFVSEELAEESWAVAQRLRRERYDTDQWNKKR